MVDGSLGSSKGGGGTVGGGDGVEVGVELYSLRIPGVTVWLKTGIV